LTDVVVANAEASGDAGTESFDDDIGFGRELERVYVFVVPLQVEHDAPLVGVEAREQIGIGTHRVATGRLDLDDVCADLSKQLRGVRTGTPHADVEHPYPAQQSVHDASQPCEPSAFWRHLRHRGVAAHPVAGISPSHDSWRFRRRDVPNRSTVTAIAGLGGA
jgi:hypothetical protein